jgi:hypothetical protein
MYELNTSLIKRLNRSLTEDGRMPWKTSNEEQQRRKFCEAALSRKGNFEQLCKSYGIRRQTGHKWLKRLKEEGYKGLKIGVDDRTGCEVLSASKNGKNESSH